MSVDMTLISKRVEKRIVDVLPAVGINILQRTLDLNLNDATKLYKLWRKDYIGR